MRVSPVPSYQPTAAPPAVVHPTQQLHSRITGHAKSPSPVPSLVPQTQLSNKTSLSAAARTRTLQKSQSHSVVADAQPEVSKTARPQPSLPAMSSSEHPSQGPPQPYKQKSQLPPLPPRGPAHTDMLFRQDLHSESVETFTSAVEHQEEHRSTPPNQMATGGAPVKKSRFPWFRKNESHSKLPAPTPLAPEPPPQQSLSSRRHQGGEMYGAAPPANSHAKAYYTDASSSGPAMPPISKVPSRRAAIAVPASSGGVGTGDRDTPSPIPPPPSRQPQATHASAVRSRVDRGGADQSGGLARNVSIAHDVALNDEEQPNKASVQVRDKGLLGGLRMFGRRPYRGVSTASTDAVLGGVVSSLYSCLCLWFLFLFTGRRTIPPRLLRPPKARLDRRSYHLETTGRLWRRG